MFVRVAIPAAAIAITCAVMVTYVQMPLRFLLTGVVSVLVAAITVWLFALEEEERLGALRMIKKKK